MFACKNCGGNVKYDIASGQLACEYCHSLFDPYAYEDKTSDAEVSKDFDATIFTCPQCGGEIISTDNTAAGFCSFCGASTVLYSRISKEHRPDYIIPFQKTKDDCKQAYSRLMAKAIFAPSELKDPKKIDSFRGIYMPYWTYYVTLDGSLNIPATKSQRRGDYIITDHFNLTGTLDSYYKGLSYDASSSFDDSISESLAPYDVKGMKGFTPAYLSGFYGDTADVDSAVYKPDAEETAFTSTVDSINKVPAFRGYNIKKGSQTPQSLNTTTKEINYSLFPVWFMSYRNNDRVAYATVNGQTGKVVADIPISFKKFLAGSFITAIPIFILLCFISVLTPGRTMLLVGFLSIAVNFIYSRELASVALKESGEDDLGKLSKQSTASGQESGRISVMKASRELKRKTNTVPLGVGIIIVYCVLLAFCFFGNALSGSGNADGSRIAWFFVTAFAMFYGIQAFAKFDKLPGHKGLFGLVFNMISLVYGTAIAMIQPIMDYWYYSAALLIIVALFVTLWDCVNAYNVLSTRKLPQFSYTGGDDRA